MTRGTPMTLVKRALLGAGLLSAALVCSAIPFLLAADGTDPVPVTIPCPFGTHCVCVPDPTTTTTSTSSTSSSTTTSTTVRPTTTTTIQPGDCAGPRTVLENTRTTTYRPTIAPDGLIDATDAAFLASPTNKYAVQVGGGPGGCWVGGLIQGTFPRTLTWSEMHDQYNPTAFRIATPGFLVEALRIDDAGDGIKARAEDFTIRDAHLTWVRDDCIENIDKHSGVIEDSLLESCYVGMSTRSDTPGDPHAVVTFRRTLLGLVPMPGPHDSETGQPCVGNPSAICGHGNFLKDSSDSPAVVIEDSIFFADGQTNSEGGIGLPSGARVLRCRNNLLVYVGAEPLNENHLGRDPLTGAKCFTVSRDRRDWDAAVAAWKAAHR